ncbi:MAG: YihY/virulence factor BrkB family protein [Syntrophorhabdales bacterium]|jgi:YihY family inner membrane protein
MSKTGLMTEQKNVRRSPGRPFSFPLRVARGFMRNQGLLLSGAIAYYTLLSIVPMSILAVIGLSHFVREDSLFQTLSTYAGMVMPGYAAILNQQVRVFIEHRHTVGIIGVLAMLFFSSMAFGVLQSSLSVIFVHRARTQRRNFLVSAVIPYAYVFAIGLVIVLVSFITAALEILENRQLMLFGRSLSLELTFRVVLYAMGVVSEVLMLTSLYLFMPAVRIRFSHALIGGITATILWELTRRGLIWYYSTLSMVNLIYGSFATAVVALLTAEAIALIVLLGAQVIAELEHKTT